MNFEALYQDAKAKQLAQQKKEELRHYQIQQLSSMKKINSHSNLILVSKISEQLSSFDDQNLINIETSIPMLHSTGILQSIENIQSAKQKLDRGQFQNSRLRDQAKFVYCLWKMVDEQEIESRQLKQIIYALHDRSQIDLKKFLSDMYHEEDAVVQFIQIWKILAQSSKYYKSVGKTQNKKEHKKDKKAQKSININQVLTEKNFYNEFHDIQECFLKKSLDNSKGNRQKKLDLITMESYSTKNKENTWIDRQEERCLIDRLYHYDKYQIREAQKKVQDERRARAEMNECTFQPVVNNRLRSVSNPHKSRSVNGYEKSVQRMKIGIQKQRIQKEKLSYKPVGQNYYKLRSAKINPPKFLDRQKKQETVLFMIQFDLGRHKVKVKVHQNDSEDVIAKNLCKIYCLKPEFYQQIKSILQKERQMFQNERSIFE